MEATAGVVEVSSEPSAAREVNLTVKEEYHHIPYTTRHTHGEIYMTGD